MVSSSLCLSVANPKVVARCGAKVISLLEDRYIMDEVTITEFKDPQIVEHVAMVTLSNVECNKTKNHVRSTSTCMHKILFTLVVKIF